MRKQALFLLVAFCMTVMLVSCSKPPRELIVGEWSGPDHTGEVGSLVFYEDGRAKMVRSIGVMDGSSIGGKLTWVMDEKQDPMHLDLILLDSEGQVRVVIPMIVKFMSNDKIKVRTSPDMNARPTEFSDADKINQIVLTRQ